MSIFYKFAILMSAVIPSDYSSQLTNLLRYPSLSTSNDYHPSDTHHSVLLLRQAFALYTAPNAATGASIVVENRNLLGIPIEVPETPVTRRKGAKMGPRRTASVEFIPPTQGKSSSGRRGGEISQSVQLGLPELIAKGLLETGESLGINKTVMSAVSELRVSPFYLV